MPKFRDLTGFRFGLWTVMERASNAGTVTRWRCRCDCGTERAVRALHLVSGASRSCGCNPHAISHGASVGGIKRFSGAYKSWRAMRSRVLDPNHKNFARYGGRGIRICERWNDFAAFLEDMGDRPSDKHSLDRFPDPDGNYEAKNCRWATQRQQVAGLPQNQPGYKHKRRRGCLSTSRTKTATADVEERRPMSDEIRRPK